MCESGEGIQFGVILSGVSAANAVEGSRGFTRGGLTWSDGVLRLRYTPLRMTAGRGAR
jgi:hypothetical protein